jgi:OTU domain-containing protein 6
MSEEVTARHKKELKALDGEKRAALKKAKTTAGKGKKAKDVLAALEAEYETKLKELEARHESELSVSGTVVAEEEPVVEEDELLPVATVTEEIDPEEEERQRKIEKARLKREKAKQKELDREKRIEQENSEAGPSPRDVENIIILQQLDPLNLEMQEVAADGHCLYRAVAAQQNSNYQEMRAKCADTLLQHEHDFGAFCEYTDSVPDFKAYVERVRSSADWGGHLELRILSLALHRPITVYRAQAREPLVIEEEQGNDSDPIRLSFHLNYYALGEHYNQVCKKS